MNQKIFVPRNQYIYYIILIIKKINVKLFFLVVQILLEIVIHRIVNVKEGSTM